MAILFVATWIILLIYAVRLMSKGWALQGDINSGKFIETSTKVTRPPHPEMMEVKPGDELMVVKFGEEEPIDPLHESLKNRIEELKDDDDDEGGALVPAVK